MKYLFIGVPLVLSLLLLSSYKFISSNNKKGEFSLIWSDEFDKAGAPDPAKWGFDIGTGSDGWGNQELEFYTERSQNAFVENGFLKVKAIKEDFKGSAYTSARLLSKGKFEFMYGKVEVRAKVPAAVGTWPAVWMMGGDIEKVGWPSCGEVDILEHRGSELNKVVGAMHYPGRAGGNCNTNSTLVNTASTEFHIYKAEWSNNSVQFFVDDKLFHSVPLTPEMPYHKNFFLLVNLAIGGGFGGPVDPSFKNAVFEIDYIRVYK
jgi:beta-glucanase (GH16 family)